jgi:flagellar hook-associated protein 2
MRLTGFQSGLDINQMVSDLMKAQRMPMNKLTQQKQLLEWKRDDYRETNRLLNDFRNLSFDMTLQRTYSQKQVTSSNDKISATASTSAANVSYTLSGVQVATVATNSSSSTIMNDGRKLDTSTSIWEQRGDIKNFGDLASPFSPKTLAGESDRINVGTDFDAADLKVVKVTSAEGETVTYTIVESDKFAEGKNQAYYNKNTGELIFSNNLEEGSEIVAPPSYNFSMTTYNQAGEPVTQDFSFSADASMNDIVAGINSSPLGITAFYDEHNGGLVITKREAGDFNAGGKEIQFQGTFLTSVMNLNQDNEQGGTSAKVTINGVATERNSNTFSINGVTFNLKENMAPGESAVINVANDTDKTFNAIKDYITKYNELIEKINGKLGEPVYRDYKPLSTEEKESLSEKQIEQWEEKARSGLLRNDSILSSGLSRMRMNFYEPINVTGAYNQLSTIGISTGSNYMDKGKLIIDDEKLRAAIEKDPTSVMELFTANGADSSSKGLARKLRESVTSTIQGIEARAGNQARTAQQFTIGRELLNVDQRISAFERRMQTVEDRYWRQFTAMEKAIGQANNQSMQLMSQFYNG